MSNTKFNQVLASGRTKLREILQEMIDEKLFAEQSTKIPEVFALQSNYPDISDEEFLSIVSDYADLYYILYKDRCEENSVKLRIRNGRMSDHIVFSPHPLNSSILWNFYANSISTTQIQKKVIAFVEEVLNKNDYFLDFLVEEGYLPEEPTVTELEVELDKQVRVLLGFKGKFEVCKNDLDKTLFNIYESVKNALNNRETGE